ncbi:MAG: formate dehydrogenase accessory sulfurtransferase FdhD [Deltaproteobacteria bacterium]|nr:formate dehydrogenase accessory sulfurtransferase FdhD [Deltaproteobacteria bacterium]
MASTFLTLPAKIITPNGMRDLETRIIGETTLTIIFNDVPLATSACCGLHLQELAVGFLFAEGYIVGKEDLSSVSVEDGADAGKYTARVTGVARRALKEDGGCYTILSSGAKTTLTEERKAIFPEATATISPQEITPLFDALVKGAAIHNATRGTHSGGIVSKGNILVIREDIGRHNVADMLVGYALLNGIALADKCVVRTGRVSLEIATKYRRAGIVILLSLSVPTLGAIDYAKSNGMCLISAQRNKEPIVYCGHERVGE